MRIRLSLAALLASVSCATAADIGSSSYDADVGTPSYDWSGFYAGITTGVTTLRSQNDYDPDNYYGDLDAFDLEAESGDLSVSATALGGIVGLQGGFNYQTGNTVVGLEMDASLMDASNTASANFCDYCDDPVYYYRFNQETTSSIDMLGTFRGRAGIAADKTLWFATAGLAFGHVTNNYTATINTDSGDPDDSVSSSESGWKFGWTAGAGVEHALTDDLSIKVEGLYYNLGASSLGDHKYNGLFDQYAFHQEVVSDGFIGKIGLNYSF